MRIYLTIGLALLAFHQMARPAPEEVAAELTPQTDEMLSADALARYSEPGQPIRYKALLEAMSEPPETLGEPSKGLRLTVRSWPDGRPQTIVQAKEAWMTLDTSVLRGRGVHVEQFKEDGSLEAVLDVDEILVNRTEMLAVAKGKVRGVMEGDVLTGAGALIDMNIKYLRLIKQACIETKRMGDVKLTDRGIF